MDTAREWAGKLAESAPLALQTVKEVLRSIEGDTIESDARRGRTGVYDKTLAGIDAALRHKLLVGVASSVCATNYDQLVREEWVDKLIEMGVHYCWFHTYRAVGPDAVRSVDALPGVRGGARGTRHGSEP